MILKIYTGEKGITLKDSVLLYKMHSQNLALQLSNTEDADEFKSDPFLDVTWTSKYARQISGNWVSCTCESINDKVCLQGVFYTLKWISDEVRFRRVLCTC